MAIEAISSSGGAKSYGTTDVKSASAADSTADVQQVQAEDIAPALNFNSRQMSEDSLKSQTTSENTIKQAISDINKKINHDTVAEYGYHKDTHRVTIKIVDKKSEKVIKEYPAEETLDMIAKVWELAGLFLDEKR